MVVLSKPALDQFSPIKTYKTTNTNNTPSFPNIPIIDISHPDSSAQLVKACTEFGFFKVVNHAVPTEFVTKLETEAMKFFQLPLAEKEKAGPPDPFGYGNKNIGPNGDVGWIEYILLRSNPESVYQKATSVSKDNPELFCSLVNNYISATKKLGSDALELIAEGLNLQEKNVFSKMILDKESDSVFRLNHYPPASGLQALSGKNLVGFGEHTDPQIISILRSNNAMGLQISLKDGSWVPVPPDQNSFFFIVGDSLQVMTNGRFQSVRHRVIANSIKSRISMIYFGGPRLEERIAPLESLMQEDEESLYKEFTWFEYKKSAYMSRLADNRLGNFRKTSPLVAAVDPAADGS